MGLKVTKRQAEWAATALVLTFYYWAWRGGWLWEAAIGLLLAVIAMDLLLLAVLALLDWWPVEKTFRWWQKRQLLRAERRGKAPSHDVCLGLSELGRRLDLDKPFESYPAGKVFDLEYNFGKKKDET